MILTGLLVLHVLTITEESSKVTMLTLYPNNLKNWNLDAGKAPGISLRPNSNSSGCLDIEMQSSQFLGREALWSAVSIPPYDREGL